MARSTLLAITHLPSPKLAECQLTFVERGPIDYGAACRQHAAYRELLRDCGADVVALAGNLDRPDGVFVEDAAIVLPEGALITRPGAESRRAEVAAIEAELSKHRLREHVLPPATLEGGDVLRVGRTLLVGLSSRTNAAGVDALRRFAGRYGYDVRPVPVHGSLHLKTACTALPDGRLLVNRAWLDVAALDGFDLIDVPAAEPWGANVALVGEIVCAASEHAETADLVLSLGFPLRTVALSEFAKAEGGVTCLSLLVG